MKVGKQKRVEKNGDVTYEIHLAAETVDDCAFLVELKMNQKKSGGCRLHVRTWDNAISGTIVFESIKSSTSTVQPLTQITSAYKNGFANGKAKAMKHFPKK